MLSKSARPIPFPAIIAGPVLFFVRLMHAETIVRVWLCREHREIDADGRNIPKAATLDLTSLQLFVNLPSENFILRIKNCVNSILRFSDRAGPRY